MFRQINLKSNPGEFKAFLYKNRREILKEIPVEYLGNIKYSIDEIASFTITVPKYIQDKGKNLLNPLYNKIRPSQQVILRILEDGQYRNERYILLEPNTKETKRTGSKTLVAYSFERTLKGKRTSFDGKVIQLKSNTVDIAEGIMDKFVRETGWKIGTVDPKSRVEEMSVTEKVNVDLFNGFSKNNITENSLIFEKNITTTISANRPLYLSIEYKNFKTYDGSNLLIETPSIFNSITDALHLNIKKIQAYHYSDIGNRYGIRYVFTLSDNTTVERILVFTNIINKNISCENIKLVWESGNVISTTNTKYINIEKLDGDWYETLRSLQDKFNSIFVFDGYNKTLSVVHRDNLGGDYPYILTYDNAILDIDVKENLNNITGLKISGKDGLSIVSENIYGDDIVRSYNELIRLGILSEELEVALGRYENFLSTKQQEWFNIRNNSVDETQKKIRIDSEIKSLEERIKNYKNLLTGYMAANDSTNQARIKGEIDLLEARMNELLGLRTQYQNNIIAFEKEMMAISNSTDKKNATDSKGKIFTELDLEELNDVENIEFYEDDYYSNSFALLNASKKILENKLKPQIDFKISCENLVKIIQNKKGWRYFLRLGNLFKLKGIDVINEIGEDTIRLVSYEYNPVLNKVENLSFTSKDKFIDDNKSFSSLGRKIAATSDKLNTWKNIIEDSKMSTNFAKEILEGGLDLAAHTARGRGISNYIDISESGIFLYDQSDMNKALYIGSSLICISTDGFKTSETAISSDGIFAKLLVGSVILGQKLYITSENGEFYIGDMDVNSGFGLRVKDSTNTERIFLGTELVNGVRKARLRLVGSAGEMVLSEDGIVSEVQFPDRDHVDENAPFRSYFRVGDNVSQFKECILNVILKPFRVYSKGLEAGGKTISQGYTSVAGGGGTSGAGGYRDQIVSSGTQSYVNFVSEFSTNMADTSQSSHFHVIPRFQFDHGHSVGIYIPSHTHSVPSHTHTTTVSVDTTHTHSEKYGCIDLSGGDNSPSGCSLYVNGNLVRSNFSSNIQLDIKDYLIKNALNEIVITSRTRGVIHTHIYNKSFVLW